MALYQQELVKDCTSKDLIDITIRWVKMLVKMDYVEN